MAWTEVDPKPPLRFDKDKEKKTDKKAKEINERSLRMELLGLKETEPDKPIVKKPNVVVFSSSKDNK